MSYLSKQEKKRITKYYSRLMTLFVMGLVLFGFIYQARAAIVIGNPKGKVTLQFIYDYQCPHCHQLYLTIQSILNREKDLNVKCYPVAVINQNSLIEATAAIAATQYPNKFQILTNTLMIHRPLSSKAIMKVLALMGLNTTNFLKSMHSQWVKSQLLEGLTILHHYHVKEVPLLVLYSNTTQKINSKNKPVIFIGEISEKRLALAIHQIKKSR